VTNSAWGSKQGSSVTGSNSTGGAAGAWGGGGSLPRPTSAGSGTQPSSAGNIRQEEQQPDTPTAKAAQTLHGDHDLHLDLVYKSKHKCNLKHHFHGLAVHTHYGEVLHCLGLGIPLKQLWLLLQHGVVMQLLADWYAYYVAHIYSYDFASVNFGSVPPSLNT